MRKIGFGAALLALISGGVGFILQSLYLTRAVEPDTGLPVIGAPSILAMLIYTGFIVVLAFVLACVAKRVSYTKKTYSDVIAPVNTAYCCCAGISSLFLLVSGIAGIYKSLSGIDIEYVLLIRAVLIILTAVSIAGMTIESIKKGEPKGSLVYSIVPEVAMTFWLLVYYRSNQTNPVLLDYAFFSLALAAAAFAFYFTAGYVYGRHAPMRLIFSHSVAVYFLLTTLSDKIPDIDKMASIGLALFFTLNLSRFVGNLQTGPRVSEAEKPEHES